MSAKVEVLTDRIGKVGRVPTPLRAVRHVDAARKKLEKLQAWRQELKAELTQCIGERDAAVREVERLKSERDARLAELGRATERLDAQEALIAEFRDERARLLEKYEPAVTIGADAIAEPALTFRVLEKIDFDVGQQADQTIAIDATVGDGRQWFGWVKRLLPRSAP
ncbi:MAG: hypothetical protein OER85_09380 [Gammaproteobacteria bacterium]|nr:hypothetical protein [Gammaproteobacteria bacterium]